MKSKTKTPDEGPRIEMLPVADVRPRERNPRKHPQEQIDALARSIREFGFTAPVLIESDGTLIAGHGRVEAARKAGLERVPCLRVAHLTPEQVRAYVIADNRLALDATWDEDALGAELKALADASFDLKLTGCNAKELQKLLFDVEASTESTEAKELDVQPQPTGIFGYREDALLPSSNKWGVPDIREDMLLDAIPDDVWVNQQDGSKLWLYMHGSNAVPSRLKTVRAFYVDDYRFENVWTDAVGMIDTLKASNHAGLVEPDFSLWWEMPFSVQLYNVYRSRWCARYWQEAGFKIIPSLKWAAPNSFEVSTAGLPATLKLASVQCRTLNNGKANERFKAGLRHQLETIKIKTLMAYGGQQHKDLFTGLPCDVVFLPSWTQRRNELRKIR